jgi:hypothetical protein
MAHGCGYELFSRPCGVSVSNWNGNMVISASASQTGLLQDTTGGHTGSLAVGDDFDISYQFGTGFGTTAQVLQGCWLTSSNGDSIYSCANDQGTSFNTSVTAYAGLCEGLEVIQTSETNALVLDREYTKMLEL